jgi:peptidoglycan-associated lipoprotein
MLRRVVILTCLSAVALGACSKKKPVVTPTPAPASNPQVSTRDTAAERMARENADRMRADSIANAKAAADRAAQQQALAALRGTLEETVYFDYNEDKLRTDAQEALGRKVPILRANTSITVRVTGHTDERGSVEYNQALGMRRAQAVKDYLSDFGIDAGRIEIVSMGEDQPQDPGHDETAWAKNRRAQFTITGGSPTVPQGQ